MAIQTEAHSCSSWRQKFGRSAHGVKVVKEHFYANIWESPVLMHSAIDGIKNLRSGGVPIGIVTNGGSVNQRKKLQNSNPYQLADSIIISEEFGSKKPDPAIFKAICHQLEINPEKSWFIGDHPVLDTWLEGRIPWPAGYQPCYKFVVNSLEAVWHKFNNLKI